MIDPVRFITNRSSGKQGYEIANSLVENGFDTTLISGPTNLKPNDNLKLIKVKTGEEMHKKTMELLPCDLAIFTAAVSDFKVKKFNKEKIKKNKDQSFNLDLNPDILELVSKSNKKQKIVVGFAAETENLFDNARSKLGKKCCDLIGFWQTKCSFLQFLFENKIKKKLSPPPLQISPLPFRQNFEIFDALKFHKNHHLNHNPLLHIL